jgi:hypothetical protein
VPTASASRSPVGAPLLGGPDGPQDDEEQRRKNEFRLNTGKVIDTLRADYPRFFDAVPDWSIYESSIELHDPSGISLRGIATYKSCFSAMRMLRRYATTSVELSSKVCYAAGWDPYKVKVRWHVAFSTLLNPNDTYYIDGVSVYTLSERGLVKRHDLDNVIVNGREAQQPYLQLLNPLQNPTMAGLLSVPGAGAVALPTLFSAEDKAPRAKEKKPPRPLFKPKSALEFCETNYECEYPLFCCDLLLTKVCCSNGAFAPAPQGPIPIPIPIPIDDPWSYQK